MPSPTKPLPGQFDGVSFDKRRGRWIARPYTPLGRTYLGSFEKKSEADLAVFAARYYFDTADSFTVSLDTMLERMDREEPVEVPPAAAKDHAQSQADLDDLLCLLDGQQQTIARLLVSGYEVKEIAVTLVTTIDLVQGQVEQMKVRLIQAGYTPL